LLLEGHTGETTARCTRSTFPRWCPCTAPAMSLTTITKMGH